jgi:ABC-type amino acid transport system permease subunit
VALAGLGDRAGAGRTIRPRARHQSWWDWPIFVEYFTADAVLKALRVTVELTLYGTFFGFLLGISLFKGTSIVSVMAIAELFYQVQVIFGRNGRVVPLLMVATVWYIVLTTILTVAQYYIERYFAKGSERELPPTPLQRLRGEITEITGERR